MKSRKEEASAPDFFVQNEGSIFLLDPQTDAAHAWIEGNIVGDEHQFFGEALCVEHRYILDIVDGIRNDGLLLQ